MAGAARGELRPALGNHEYYTPNAGAYFAYFDEAAGDPTKGYYSYDLGAWHLIVINSNCRQIRGCQAGSPQETWLRKDLATNTRRCTVRQFVVGTGGAHFNRFAEIQPNSEVRNNDTFGVLKLTLKPDGYDWQFVPVEGKTFTDAGSGTCH